MTAVLTRPRLLAAGGPSLDEHRAAHGPLPPVDPRALAAELARSGLTGRGGAGFPSARKADAVARAAARRAPVVVANGSEGEPASSKDRLLLTAHPHLVLDGLHAAGRLVGAGSLHLVAPADVLPAVDRALRERAALGEPPVHLAAAPDRYVAGQESAVVRLLSGGPALPTDDAVRVTERGLGGAPTLVHNAETLAHLALVARHGAAWFRERGTPEEPGTALATISGAVRQPGVVEVDLGTPLHEVLCAAGGPGDDLVAVLVGGYHGGWVPADRLDAPLSRAGLAAWGASPGAGVVVALPADRCGLQATADVVDWLAGESAGQCGPCAFGLPSLAGLLARLADAGDVAPADLVRAAALVEGRGACRHPDGTARLVRSALVVFADEVALHAQGLCTRRTS